MVVVRTRGVRLLGILSRLDLAAWRQRKLAPRIDPAANGATLTEQIVARGIGGARLAPVEHVVA